VGSPGQEIASRPHPLLRSSVFFWLQAMQISPVEHISDYCTMSVLFMVEDAGVLADWSSSPGIVVPLGAVEISTLECLARPWRTPT